MRVLTAFSAMFFLFSCQSSESNADRSSENSEQHINLVTDSSDYIIDTVQETENSYSASAIYNENLGWGYQILNNGKPYINQPHIPAIEGMKGFSTEQDALKTAEMVIAKLNNNIVPPSVSVKELDSLGIAY